ncbi:hypothetical protein K466DRAFT_605672 [Polyporus arcularius HHB13444]|uniref:Uncharacterized protein n=1 Tax=Polyporus arcularius HHB13444 TaxID=1314778 RepID=A0A5C3NRM3_9APHY|nr:hypothetical protein K466DRAFT_605672 [Polyporus arcularius HHB13444]
MTSVRTSPASSPSSPSSPWSSPTAASPASLDLSVCCPRHHTHRVPTLPPSALFPRHGRPQNDVLEPRISHKVVALLHSKLDWTYHKGLNAAEDSYAQVPVARTCPRSVFLQNVATCAESGAELISSLLEDPGVSEFWQCRPFKNMNTVPAVVQNSPQRRNFEMRKLEIVITWSQDPLLFHISIICTNTWAHFPPVPRRPGYCEYAFFYFSLVSSYSNIFAKRAPH